MLYFILKLRWRKTQFTINHLASIIHKNPLSTIQDLTIFATYELWTSDNSCHRRRTDRSMNSKLWANVNVDEKETFISISFFFILFSLKLYNVIADQLFGSYTEPGGLNWVYFFMMYVQKSWWLVKWFSLCLDSWLLDLLDFSRSLCSFLFVGVSRLWVALSSQEKCILQFVRLFVFISRKIWEAWDPFFYLLLVLSCYLKHTVLKPM